MGLAIDRATFSEDDYARFAERLSESITALQRVLRRPGFGEGPATLGAELELFLVDRLGGPAPVNLEVLARVKDPRVTAELNRYNLELNFTPVPAQGRPFSDIGRETRELLDLLRTHARDVGARIAAVGILPTLREEHMGRNALTPLPRYRALSAGVRRSRGGAPFRINVAKEESLSLEWDDVTLEGGDISVQFHLRVRPACFADVFNAAQIATAPALAISANSPIFLERRLWDETRIAIFRQATDDRGELPTDWSPPARVSFGHGWARRGAAELFAETVALHPVIIPHVDPDESPLAAVEAGRVPKLHELRLHNGTVWHWNRPVYDPAAGGHLRIELRALPSGPTVTDMLANGAFLLGLTLGIAPDIERYLPGLPFSLARENFHRAARDGVDAVLLWPSRTAPSPMPVPVLDLLPGLLDIAARGLDAAGVDADEYSRLLQVIRDRALSGMTGARWLGRMLDRYEAHTPRRDALARVLERYMALSEEGHPVHEWPTDG